MEWKASGDEPLESFITRALRGVGLITPDEKRYQFTLRELRSRSRLNQNEVMDTWRSFKPEVSRKFGLGWVFALFGILLPVVAIVWEVVSGLSAEIYRDPFPTWFHFLLVLSVPVFHTFAFVSTRKEKLSHAKRLLAMNGFISVISGYYMILFLPFIVYGVIGLIVYGMGLLPLSPIIAFFCSVCCYLTLRCHVDKEADNPRPYWLGAAVGLVLVLGLHLPKWSAQIGTEMVTRGNAQWEANGLAILRSVTPKSALLANCYPSMSGHDWTRYHGDQGPFSHTREEARDTYYRVTGESFLDEKDPRGGVFPKRSRMWDSNVGSDTVAGRVSGLTLVKSSLEGSVEVASNLAYSEWTMVFENKHFEPREGRFQVSLPRDAFISRLTLWVNGKPEEAAFSCKEKVKAAYQKVAVVQRRDPVLVTSSGADRVFVQCFPVPVNGEMKIRLGITAPLQDKGQRLSLPLIVERNFEIKSRLKHQVAIRGLEEGSEVNFRNDQLDLAGNEAMIKFPKNEIPDIVWTEDRFAKPEAKYLRRTLASASSGYDKMVVVIDTSGGMKPFVGEIQETLEAMIPADFPTAVVLADDAVKIASAFTEGGMSEGLFDGITPRGGKANTEALIAALRMSSENTAVVWIHGPQPFVTKLEKLESMLESSRADLFSVSMKPGANRILEHLKDSRFLVNDVRREDLSSLLMELVGERRAYRWERYADQGTASRGAKQVSDHLARSWAHERVMKNFHKNGPESGTADVRLAATYQLVSPVSGAVVLETQQQYHDAGLEQVDVATVAEMPATTSVPEPGTGILMMIGALLMMSQRRRAS